MVLFGLLNYEDYIFRTIATSNYARNALTVLFTYLITGIIRFHLSAIFCWIFTMNNILDLFIPIVVGVMFALLSDTLYQYVGTHRSAYERLVDYLITYYSRDNMIKWKRYVLIGIFAYILIVLMLIDIDNTFMLVSTIQTAITFIICDILENREKVYHNIDQFFYRPKARKVVKQFAIIHNYPDNTDGDQSNSPHPDKGSDRYITSGTLADIHVINSTRRISESGRSLSPPIPVKPPTPPRVQTVISNVKPLTPPRVHVMVNRESPMSSPIIPQFVQLSPTTPSESHKEIPTTTYGQRSNIVGLPSVRTKLTTAESKIPDELVTLSRRKRHSEHPNQMEQ